MSNLTVKGNASGTGTVILEAPNTNSNRTITLPDATATLATTAYVDSSVAAIATGPTLGTAVASTSGTAIDFTGIPSTAKRVTVMFSGVSFSSNPSSIWMRVGTSSGLETSGYSAASGRIAASSASGSAYVSDSVFELVTGASSASETFWGHVIFSKITGNMWAATGAVGTDATYKVTSFCGAKTLSSSLDRLRIYPQSAVNFDAGTINISWE